MTQQDSGNGRFWLTVAALVLVVLLLGAYGARAVEAPGLLDAMVDFHGAENLACGRGLVIDYLPDYEVRYAHLAGHPSHASRPPGQALLLGAAFALRGPTLETAQMVGVAALLLLVVGTWVLARVGDAPPGLAAAAALLVAFDPLVGYATATADAALPAAVAALGALLLVGSRPCAAMALASAGSLFRRDGVVVVLVILFLALRASGRTSPHRLRFILLMFMAWFLPQLPWLVYSVVTYGVLPGTVLDSVVLASPADTLRYGYVPALLDLIPGGAVAGGRAAALWAVLRSTLVRDGLTFLVPFALLALPTVWATPRLRPVVVHAAAVVLLVPLLLACRIDDETVRLAGVALAPGLSIMGLTGLCRALSALATRFQGRGRPTLADATSRSAAAAPWAIVLVSAAVWAWTMGPATGAAPRVFRDLSTLFAAVERTLVDRGLAPSAALITAAPQATWHWCRRPCLPMPLDDDPAALVEAARRFDADHVLVLHRAGDDRSWSADRYRVGDAMLVRVSRRVADDARSASPQPPPTVPALAITGFSVYELMPGGI